MPVLDQATAPAPAVHQHNKRVAPCPGYSESRGVMGYTSLGNLRSDVADYLASFYTEAPTPSPTTTLVPTPDTLSPTMRPSQPPTPGHTSPPSAMPTVSPSEIPTKAPVTLRPTRFPTGSIRLEKNPTRSPSPTIELYIVGGISAEEFPTDPSGPSPTGADQEISFNGPTRRAANPPTQSTGLTSLPYEERRKGERARGDSLVNEYYPGGGAVRWLSDGIAGDAADSQVITEADGTMEEVVLTSANAEGKFSDGTDIGTPPPVQLATAKGEGDELDLVLGVSGNSDRMPQELQESYESALSEWFDSLEHSATGGAAAWEMSTQRERSFSSTSPAPAATFYICPNTRFQFDDSLDPDSPLLRLETPLIYHPVEIRCMGDCHFIGGGWHIMFDHNLKFANKLDDVEVEEAHPITISGITFQEAGRASIVMLDPVGAVIFENCLWLSNVKGAIVIDGLYNATEHLTSSPTGTPTLAPTSDPARTTTTSTLDWSIMTMTSTTSSFGHMAGLTDDEFGRELDGIDDKGRSTGSRSKTTIATARSVSRSSPGLDRKEGMSNKEEEGHYSGINGAEADFEFEEEPSRGGMRSLAPETAPRSIVTIKNCSFSGNKGNATIVVSSHSHEFSLADQDPGVLIHTDDTLNEDNESDDANGGIIAHSIHLVIEDTAFTDEDMEVSLIANYGGRVQSSGVVFMSNAAESIISSENGTLAIASTEIKWNDVKGELGVVVLCSGSVLEENEGNCATPSVDNGTLIATVVGDDNGRGQCEGIVLGGDCSLFDLCEAAAPASSPNIGIATTILPTLEEELEGCFSSWGDLSTAVHSRVMDRRDFVICPGATLLATAPVVISSDYVTIRCGTEQSPSSDCTITGGFSHFHVTSASKGVELARLIMESSTGSSVMAIGTRDATLKLTQCKWLSNTGASAVLIHNDEKLNTASSTLDFMPLLRDELLRDEVGAGAAMSVEVSSCIFGGNELNLGAITNIGGTLTIKTTNFIGNLGMGGDVLVANKGSLAVGHSCFNASSSTTPGVIFVQRGSQVMGNNDNFGFDVTAGGYSEGTCKDIFQEADEVDCLAFGTCDGRCTEFSASKCMIGGEGEESTIPGTPSAPSSVDEGAISVPHFSHREKSGSSTIVPIVIGTLVGLLTVLGLVGIYVRRRKAHKDKGGSSSTPVHDSEGTHERSLSFLKRRQSEQRGGDSALAQGGLAEEGEVDGAGFVDVSNCLGVVEDYGLEGADFVDVGNPLALDSSMA